MSDTVLTIDGLPVPIVSRLEIDQRYEQIQPVWFRRLADNSGILRATGSAKLSTTITGRGWMPAALQTLALGSTHTIGCIAWRDVASASPVITLPAARRVDAGHSPVGYAVVDGELIEAAQSGTAGDVISLTPVGGATHYVVYYLPLIVARVIRAETRSESSAQHPWALEVEEV
jgi:hypothetical protein